MKTTGDTITLADGSVAIVLEMNLVTEGQKTVGGELATQLYHYYKGDIRDSDPQKSLNVIATGIMVLLNNHLPDVITIGKEFIDTYNKERSAESLPHMPVAGHA